MSDDGDLLIDVGVCRLTSRMDKRGITISSTAAFVVGMG
jgi:hypothetical protein